MRMDWGVYGLMMQIMIERGWGKVRGGVSGRVRGVVMNKRMCGRSGGSKIVGSRENVGRSRCGRGEGEDGNGNRGRHVVGWNRGKCRG